MNKEIERSESVGVSFGLTSGTITTLGLMIGLYAGTGSELVVVGGILTIAIADALSDALGIHVSQESTNRNRRGIWTATFYTFITKFLYALTFTIPVLVFELFSAIVICVVYGLVVLSALSWHIAKKQKEKPVRVIGEHLLIAVVVIVATYFVGEFVAKVFG